MTTAELKRRLTVGSKVRRVFAHWRGGACNDLLTVTSVNSVRVGMTDESGVERFVAWPKRGEITDTGNGFGVSIDGGNSITIQYEWVS